MGRVQKLHFCRGMCAPGVSALPRGQGSTALADETSHVLLFAFQLPLSLLKTAQNHPMVSTCWSGMAHFSGDQPQHRDRDTGQRVRCLQPKPLPACPFFPPTCVRTCVISAPDQSNACLLKVSNTRDSEKVEAPLCSSSQQFNYSLIYTHLDF